MTLRARLLLDLGLFGVLLVAYNPAWTGLAVHEWLCAAAIAPLLFHVLINWEWTKRIVSRFAGRLRALPRVNLVVDAALFVAAVGVMLSGLLVSQSIAHALGVVIVPSALWIQVHGWTADATIALLLVHFALHWKWIANASRRLAPPARPMQYARSALPAKPARHVQPAQSAPAPFARPPAMQPIPVRPVVAQPAPEPSYRIYHATRT